MEDLRREAEEAQRAAKAIDVRLAIVLRAAGLWPKNNVVGRDNFVVRLFREDVTELSLLTASRDVITVRDLTRTFGLTYGKAVKLKQLARRAASDFDVFCKECYTPTASLLGTPSTHGGSKSSLSPLGSAFNTRCKPSCAEGSDESVEL